MRLVQFRACRVKVLLASMAGRAPTSEGHVPFGSTSFPSSASNQTHYFLPPRRPAASLPNQPYIYGTESRMTSASEGFSNSAPRPFTCTPPTYGPPTYYQPTHPYTSGPLHRQLSPQVWSPYPRAPYFHHHRSVYEQQPFAAFRNQVPPPRRRAPLRPTVVVNKEVPSSNSFKLSVLSYNLLAQDLISSNPSLYSERDPGHLDWEFRKRNLLSELRQNSMDILCLQEMQEDAYESWFSPQLAKQGYSGLYKRRTGQHTDGCALFFKHDRLKLLEHKLVEFHKDFKLLDRDNVGIVAKFIPNRVDAVPESSFCVATTHLLYNPKAGEVKLAQLAYLLAELHQMASTPGKGLLPVVLCGDFNSVPVSHLCNFIMSSSLDYSNMSAVEVAGYHRRRGSQRMIPHPLFPSSVAIGNDCLYRGDQDQPIDLAQTDNPSQQSTTKSGSSNVEGQSLLSQAAKAESNNVRPDGWQVNQDCQSELSSTSGANPVNTSAPRRVLTHPFKFRSVYPHTSMSPSKSTVTTFHQSAFETVDYIFYSPISDSKGFHLLDRKALPSTHILLGLGPQPHEFLSSDHLFLCVAFQLLY